MTRILEIEGGVMRIVDRTTVREAPLNEVLPLLEHRPPITTPVLPHNVRLFRYDESNAPERKLEMIIQLDPAIRTLPYREARPNEPVRVSMPYIFFVLRMHANTPGTPTGQQWNWNYYRIYFSRTPLTDLTQRVIPATLPNVYRDARICLGDTGVPIDQPLHARIDQFVNEFFLTQFTDHQVRDYPWPFGGINGQAYGDWVTNTAANPGCWRDFPEWDENNGWTNHYSITDILQNPGAQTDDITVTGQIPVVPTVPTYGRADEWVRGIGNWDRLRLITALENLRTEEPGLFTQPMDVPA